MSIEQPRTCEELFKAVRRAGCRVNNLFHRMDGLWQCNLRGMDKLSFFEFAYGTTANQVLEKALKKVEDGRRVHPPDPPIVFHEDRDPRNVGSTLEPTNLIDPDPPSESVEADDDLIG